MTSQPKPSRFHNGKPHTTEVSRSEHTAQLEKEVLQLRQAVSSHAVIDQAIGVLICLHEISPDTGFTVLRTASQLANIQLHTVAEAVVAWAHTHQPLPTPIKEALNEALRLHLHTSAPNDGQSGDIGA
ncbi:ANTAR domain-containing protein [Streptomyces sp. 1222.5]|uniref:ANTAR domain-containing protein n=1 Tax=Streptomyces sp. 1222.5 TaxID=1881026 RepID=UPI003EB7E8BB